jgi:5-deoxy-glucuronate isomerase
MTNLTMTVEQHFEALGTEQGLNPIKSNVCKLLDFGLLRLGAGEKYAANSGPDEIMAVVLGGKCSISAGDKAFEGIGKRPNVFGGKPYSVYIPPATVFTVSGPAFGAVEVALCHARPNRSPRPSPSSSPEEVDRCLGRANFSRNFM